MAKSAGIQNTVRILYISCSGPRLEVCRSIGCLISKHALIQILGRPSSRKSTTLAATEPSGTGAHSFAGIPTFFGH